MAVVSAASFGIAGEVGHARCRRQRLIVPALVRQLLHTALQMRRRDLLHVPVAGRTAPAAQGSAVRRPRSLLGGRIASAAPGPRRPGGRRAPVLRLLRQAPGEDVERAGEIAFAHLALGPAAVKEPAQLASSSRGTASSLARRRLDDLQGPLPIAGLDVLFALADEHPGPHAGEAAVGDRLLGAAQDRRAPRRSCPPSSALSAHCDHTALWLLTSAASCGASCRPMPATLSASSNLRWRESSPLQFASTASAFWTAEANSGSRLMRPEVGQQRLLVALLLASARRRGCSR